MPSSYQILLDGQPADADFYTSITSLEVEENMDLPGAVQLNLPVNRSDSGDLTYVADSRFKEFKSVSLYQIRSLLCVPLRIKNRTLGTVYVDTRRPGQI